ncbi:ABC transporter substrate-binding protein [Micrococcaceae bacterium Sec5.1]
MKMRKYGIVGVIGLSLVLPACGTSSGSGEAGSGNPIKIMTIATLKSDAYSAPWVQTAVEAAVHGINADGGVGGRPIEALFCNDKFDPNEATACAQRAVSEGVTAIIGGVTSSEAVMTPVLEAKHIPYIGPPGTDAKFEATNAIYYPINGAGIAPMYGVGNLAVTRGGPNVVTAVSDYGTARAAGELINEAVGAAHGHASTVIVPVNAADYAPTAASILSKNPNGVALTGSSTDMVRVIRALRQAGYQGTISSLSSVATADAIQALGGSAENLVLASRGLSALDTDNPVIAEFNKEMKATDPNAVIDDIGLNSWMSVRLFAEAIKGKNITDGASVISALNEITKPINQGGVYPDYPGIVNPAPVARYPRVPVFQTIPTVIKNGKVVTDGGFYNPLDGK